MDWNRWSGVRKRRPRQHVIAEMGVNFLERQVLRRGHQLKRVPEPEYGTDALMLHFSPETREMARRLTNRALAQLLLKLGFERGHVTEMHQQTWQHAESGCTLVLPANKAAEPPRPADIVGIKAQLDLNGHLDQEAFDVFAAEGKLPARSSAQQ